MPSLLMTVGSIFSMAALMDRGGGNFVMPMLIAFDRFGSSTITSFVLFNSCCFYKQLNHNENIIFLLTPSTQYNHKHK